MRSTRNRFSRKGGGKTYRIRRQGLGKNQGSAINPVSVLVKPSDRPCIIIKGSRGTDDAFCSRGQLNLHAGANLLTSTRSEEHTSELQSLMRISYDDFCLTKTQIRNSK